MQTNYLSPVLNFFLRISLKFEMQIISESFDRKSFINFSIEIKFYSFSTIQINAIVTCARPPGTNGRIPDSSKFSRLPDQP
jgi:hypothetical protein